jgi:hypothetical protein
LASLYALIFTLGVRRIIASEFIEYPGCPRPFAKGGI